LWGVPSIFAQQVVEGRSRSDLLEEEEEEEEEDYLIEERY
jgi:hypothetical protein